LTDNIGHNALRVGRCSDWRDWDDTNSVWNTEQAMSAATTSLNIAPVVCFTFSGRFIGLPLPVAGLIILAFGGGILGLSFKGFCVFKDF